MNKQNTKFILVLLYINYCICSIQTTVNKLLLHFLYIYIQASLLAFIRVQGLMFVSFVSFAQWKNSFVTQITPVKPENLLLDPNCGG